MPLRDIFDYFNLSLSMFVHCECYELHSFLFRWAFVQHSVHVCSLKCWVACIFWWFYFVRDIFYFVVSFGCVLLILSTYFSDETFLIMLCDVYHRSSFVNTFGILLAIIDTHHIWLCFVDTVGSPHFGYR